MTDIPKITSPNILGESTLGVFDSNLLATKLDTQERLNSMFGSDFNIPTGPVIPKHLSTDDILSSPSLPKLNEYLSSSDPKLNKIADDYLEGKLANNKALSMGNGMPRMVRYQPGQKKFTKDTFFKEDVYTKYGFNPDKSIAQNEDWIYNNVYQDFSFIGKSWRNIGTFAGRVLSKLVTGLVGTVGDIGSIVKNTVDEIFDAKGNHFWADVSDNWLARKMEDLDDYVKQDILPTYKSINYDGKGVFSKLMDPYFWTNDLADGAGFLLQFAVPAIGLAKVGRWARTARGAENASKFTKFLGAEAKAGSGLAKGLQFFTGSTNTTGVAAHIFNTTMESVQETKNGFDQTVRELMNKGMSEEQAKEIAGNNAPTQFGLNMLILTASNAWENKFFQKAGGGRGLHGHINDAGVIVKDIRNLRRLPFYGRMWTQGMLAEGFWEENAQLAAQRISRGEYQRMGDDTRADGKTTFTPEGSLGMSFIKQLAQQTFDASWWGKGDREVAESIMAGAVLGVLGSTAFSKLSPANFPAESTKDNAEMAKKGKTPKESLFSKIKRGGERKNTIRATERLVADMVNAKDAWMNLSSNLADMYNEDGTVNEVKAQEKLDEVNKKMEKIQSFVGRKMSLDEITNTDKREAYQYVLFADYVKGHMTNGTGGVLIEKLKAWKDKTPEEVAMYGVSPEVAEDSAKWAQVAQNLSNKYDEIQNIRFRNTSNESVDDFLAKEAAVKSRLYDLHAQREGFSQANTSLDSTVNHFNPFKDSVFAQHNTMVLRAESYRQTLEGDISPEYRKFIQKEYDELKGKIEESKKILPEHKTSNTSDFVFESGEDIKSSEGRILDNANDYLQALYDKEHTERYIKALDIDINLWSDPAKGVAEFNESVKRADTILQKAEHKKLTDFGFTEAEIANMTPEEKQKALTEGKKEEEKKEPEEKKETSEEPEEKKPESNLEAQLNPKPFSEIINFVKNIVTKYEPAVTLDTLSDTIVDLLKQNNTLMDAGEDAFISDVDADILFYFMKRKIEEEKKELEELEKEQEEVKPEEVNNVIDTIYIAPLIELAENATKEGRADALPFNKERLDNKVKHLKELIEAKDWKGVNKALTELYSIVNEALGLKNKQDSIELEETFSLLGTFIFNKVSDEDLANYVLNYKQHMYERGDTNLGFPRMEVHGIGKVITNSNGEVDFGLTQASKRGILTESYSDNTNENKTLGISENKPAETPEEQRDNIERRLAQSLSKKLGFPVTIISNPQFEGHIDYSIRNKEGKEVARFYGEWTKKGIKVIGVGVSEDFRKGGIGKNLYRALNEQAGERNGVLYSDGTFTFTGIKDEAGRNIQAALKLWESLINTDEAIKIKGVYTFSYEMKPTNETPEEQRDKELETLEEQKEAIEEEIAKIEEELANPVEEQNAEELAETIAEQGEDLKEAVDNAEPVTVVFGSGLNISQSTEDKGEDVTTEDAQEVVEENVETVVDNIVEENVTEEEVAEIAAEEGIARNKVKPRIATIIKNAIKGIRLPKMGRALSRIVSKILKWIAALGVSILILRQTPVWDKAVGKINEVIQMTKGAPSAEVDFNTASYYVTPYKGCAKWAHSQVQEEIGIEKKGALNLVGDAWTSTYNMVQTGHGTYVYNAFTGVAKPTLADGRAVTEWIKGAIEVSTKPTLASFRAGDLINLFYENSSHTMEGYEGGRGVYTTHLGIITQAADGHLVLQHNITGVIHTDEIQDVLDSKVSSTSGGKLLVSAIARPNYEMVDVTIVPIQKADVQAKKEDSKKSPSKNPLTPLFGLGMLAIIRKKKQNGEKVTQEDLDALKKELKDIEDKMEKVKEQYDKSTSVSKIENPLQVKEETPLESGIVPPVVPPIPPIGVAAGGGAVPEHLLNEVKEALRLHEQALENDTTFKEEAAKEGMVLSNNRLNDHSNNGKNDGTFNWISSVPNDLENGKVKDKFFNLARFNFVNNLLKKKIDSNIFQLIIQEEKGNQFRAVVAAKNGKIIPFGEDGMPNKAGIPIHFMLDWDTYAASNIEKRREDVVTTGKIIAPLTSTPIDLHPSFKGVDPIALLRAAMKDNTITASINFITQGMLYREGVTNSFQIPKNNPTTTAQDYIDKGHTTETKGVILDASSRIGGRYVHNWRINFSLPNDLNNKSGGAEIVEFHPLTIGEATNSKGEKLVDILKTEDGENLFEAAIKGKVIPTSKNLNLLKTLIRPDKFMVLNTGGNLFVINLKKFKKLARTGEMTYETLKSATTVEDLYKSPLNINQEDYTSGDEIRHLPEILDVGDDNYSRFIHKNVVSSTLPISVGNKEGYHSINKRLAIKIDQSMEDIKGMLNKKKIEEDSPKDKVVDMSPEDKPTIIKPEKSENTIKTEIDGINLESNDNDLFHNIC